MAGPLSFMSNQDEEGPQIRSSFTPATAMSQPGGMASSERLSQIKEEVAPDEGPSVSDTIKEARMRLINQATGGVDPFVAWLSAKSRGGRDKYANAADAMNEAYAQRDASEEAKNLKLLNYSIEEIKARNEESRYQAGLKAKEPKSPDLYYKVGPDGKQYGPFNVNDPEEYKIFSQTPGKAFKVGTEPAPATAEKPVGYNSFLQPTGNFGEVVYGNGAEVKKAREQTRKSVIGANMAASVYDEVLKNPKAFSGKAAIETSLPAVIQSLLSENDLSSLSPEERKVRTKVFTQAALAIKEFYGVAFSRGEQGLASEWLPGKAKDNKQLLKNLQAAMEYGAEVNSQLPDEIYSNVGLDEKAVNRFIENRPKFLSGEYFKKPPPQMTGDDLKDKVIYDSLEPGDSFISVQGKPRTK